jgi:hypothetical protein
MSHDVEPSQGAPAPHAPAADPATPVADPATPAADPAAPAAPRGVTPGVLLAAEWSWRLLVIGVAVAAAVWILIAVKEVVIPFLVGILVCALLQPLVLALRRRRWPAWLAIASTLLATRS